jgi:hypothetical protein
MDLEFSILKRIENGTRACETEKPVEMNILFMITFLLVVYGLQLNLVCMANRDTDE